MDRYKETFETWNKVAKLYQDTFMKRAGTRLRAREHHEVSQ